MSKKLAPVVLFTYNRPYHTAKTLVALKNNHLSEQTELIIYSDAARNGQDQAGVEKVRTLLQSQSGFASITIHEQEQNRGLAESIITGVTKAVNEYGRVFVLEDDIVTAPGFLRYMNNALERYEQDEKVMHISSYIYSKVNFIKL